MKQQHALIFVLLISAVLSLLFLLGFFSVQQLSVSNAIYGKDKPSENIVIVAIDDKSLQEIGRWPWNRTIFASLINKLSPEASVILIDVGFFEKSPDDETLEQSINKSGKVILIAEYTEFSKINNKIYGKGVLTPVVGKADAHINLYTDKDGVSRSLPIMIEGEESFEAAALVAVERYENRTIEVPEQTMLINFFGNPGSFKRISLSDIVNNRVDTKELENKIILIGATAQDLHDTLSTPVSSGTEMSGVEFHANAIQTIMTGNYLKNQEPVEVILIIFTLSIITWLIFTRFRILVSTILVFAIAIVFFFIAIFAFSKGIILNLIYPIVSIASIYIFTIIFKYITEEKQRKWITSIFSKYLAQEVVDEIIKNPDKVKLGGERKEVTVMFSDIRGFTTMAEKMKPEDVVDFLNKYHSSVTRIIMQNKGIVIDYMGDGVMAAWGVPIDYENFTHMACKSALEMKIALKKLSKELGKDLSIGIGLNTGITLVGNIGSEDRLGYSAIGDTTNTSARFEGLNKEYGTQIIVSESTYEKVKDEFIARELDLVQAKGKSEAKRIFELLCRKDDENSEEYRNIAKLFEEGLKLYRKGDLKEAIKQFEKILKIVDDNPSKVFIQRCKEYKKTGKTGNIHKMTRK